MSSYTVTVYNLMQNDFDFGLNDYEIFDENYRPILNNCILDYYKFREIGFQNPYQWRDRLRQRLDMIMRNKYNDLYKAKAIEFNPLYNIEIHETYTRKLDTKTNTNAESEATQDGLQFSSRFPTEQMTEDKLTENIYADNASKSKGGSSTKDKAEGTDNTTEVYEHTTEGSSAGLPFSRAMIQLKQFYDKYELDQQVIKELNDLFINIW